jgi:PAS domain S-box-containing protein
MISKKEQAAELRRQAEEKFQTLEPSAVTTLPKDEVEKLFHELRVHQIEMEMQNDELRRIQGELELARSRYFDLYDLAPAGYLTLSEQGLILEINLPAVTLLGVPRSALIKRPFTQFILKEDQDIYSLHRKKLFETGDPQRCEIRMLKSDGAFFWARVDAAAAQDADGAPVCRIILADITEHKQANEKVTRLLEESNQAKTALLGIIEDDARSRIALQESEKSLVEAQLIACLGSYAWDIPSGRWESSVALDAVFGIDKNYDRTLEGWLALIHPDDRAMMSDYIKDEVIGNRQRFNREYRIIRQNDRTERWIQGMGRLELDATDAPVKLVGTIQDITERKQAENYREMGRDVLQILNAPGTLPDALQRVIAALKTRTGFDAVGLRLQDGEDFPYFAKDGFSKEFLLTENTLIAHASDGGACRNKDGSICLECTCGLVLSGKIDPVNPLFTRGGSCWMNDSFPLLDLPSDQDPRLHPRNECIHQGYASVVLIPRIVGLIHLNDRRKGAFSIEMVEQMEEIASKIGTAMMRKQAEAAKERFLTAIDQVDETIVITDAEGTIRYVNPAFERVTGYSAEEAMDQNPRILQSGQHDDTFYQQMWNTLLRGETWSGRMVNKKKDGTFYTGEAVISPVKDGFGKTVNYVAVKRDVTEELKMEEQFRQSQKMEAIGQLAGGVAHDFNNIMQAILGYSELLLGRLNEGTPEHCYCAEIKKSAFYAADLTRQLLTFSRKQPFEKKRVNLNAFIENTRGMVKMMLEGNIIPVFDLAQDLPLVSADAGQLSQIIMNLSVNARDAMPNGGQLTVKTEPIQFSPAAASARPGAVAGDFVCLAITDTGCGMSQQVKDHIFEPFFTTKGVGKGTGLGLSVLYGIVKQHNGWIDVDSEEGRGTTFKVYLPVCGEEVCASAAQPAPESEPKHEHILLVEDDPEMRKMVIDVLQSAEYQISEAQSAEEALALFNSEPEKFDMLFSDIVMPGQNGVELADALREKKPTLPVLLYSGYMNPRERWGNFDRKGYRFLQKPFTVTTLMVAVYEALADVNQPE